MTRPTTHWHGQTLVPGPVGDCCPDPAPVAPTTEEP